MESFVNPNHGSDHWPICLNIDLKIQPHNRSFYFKISWACHLDLKLNIQQWWEELGSLDGSTIFILHEKLKHIKWRLKGWKKGQSRNILEKKGKLEQKMVKIQQEAFLFSRPK